MQKKITKILQSNYLLFIISFTIMLASIWNVDLIDISVDASETWKVVKTFFSSDSYGSYVMYKGIYAFIPSIISYQFSLLFSVSEYLILKIFNALSFAYIILGISKLIEYLFQCKVKVWQKYLFLVIFYLLEKSVFYFLSVDFMSFAILLMTINLIFKITKENKKSKLSNYLYVGILCGVGVCLSGQYSISTYILIIYLIINIIKNYKKDLKKILIVFLVFLAGFSVMKGIDIGYQKIVVDDARERGYNIPTGYDWIKYGYSHNILTLNAPYGLKDNLSRSMSKYDNEEKYNIIVNEGTAYSTREYIKLILKYPITFVVRWTERVFLGLMNDPINIYPKNLKNNTFLVISFMASCLYLLWYYIKKNLKKFKDLFSLRSFVFFSVLFSILVPSFGHVENRYYFSARTIMIAIFCLSPMLADFAAKIKYKKIKWSNINMEVVTCIIFIIICLVVYFSLYQSAGVSTEIFSKLN